MKYMVLFLSLILIALPTLVFGTEPELKTIIIEPPPQTDFKIDVWTNKGDNSNYSVGENIIISFKVTYDSYVYIYDINANGEIRLIFPNRFQKDNFARANVVYSIPSPKDTYRLVVTEPYGREVIQAIASKSPLSVFEGYRANLDREAFPLIQEGAERFTEKLKKDIEIIPPSSIKPVPNWTSDTTVFYVGEIPISLGRLIVESKPKGANIYLDGKNLGITPYDGRVPTGTHSLTLELEGYQRYSIEVNISPNKTTRIDVKLKPIIVNGIFYVTSNPSGGDVFINGFRKGVTPLTVSGLTPGSYQITVIKAGYETFVAYFEIFSGETTNVYAQLYQIR